MKYTFTVPVNPQPKHRPRFGKGRTYTTDATRTYEAHVAAAAQSAGVPKITDALIVTITLMVEPKQGPILDCDNGAKAILDGLKDFFNDRQVFSLLVTRHRTPKGTGCAHVTLETVHQIPLSRAGP